MIPRPARLIAALLLSGVAIAHSQILHRGNASARESGDPPVDPFRDIHLLCRSVVDGRLMGSNSQFVDPPQQCNGLPAIPERITGGCFQQIQDGGERNGLELPFEGLTEFLWVRTDEADGSLKSFASAQREAEGARAIHEDKIAGGGLLTWPVGGIALPEGVVRPGDDVWDLQIHEVPESSATIMITLGCGLLLSRRRICR